MDKPKFMFALREDLKNSKEFLPTRAHDTDTGWDVRAAMPDRKDLVIRPFQYVKIPLGFRAFCPEGYWLKLVPRSSTFVKKQMHALYGTIDEAFSGEMQGCFQYIPHFDYMESWHDFLSNNYLKIEFGNAIGQLIPVKRQELEVIETSNEDYDNFCKARGSSRGIDGFGSTGN